MSCNFFPCVQWSSHACDLHVIYACRREPSFVLVQAGHGGHEGGELGVDGRGGRSSDGGRVGLGLLLLVLALLPKEAISRLVYGPSHVVLAPSSCLVLMYLVKL